MEKAGVPNNVGAINELPLRKMGMPIGLDESGWQDSSLLPDEGESITLG